MLVSRCLRTHLFGDSVLKLSRCSVTARYKPLSESWCKYRVNARPSNFNFNLYTTRAELKCWNCQTILYCKPCLFCDNCSIIQSADQQNLNYFELFNICEQFDVDTGQLTSKFRKLQNLMHPDKFSNKTEEEKILSDSFSSLLNKAYTTLLNPLQRGLYMLNIRGLSIEEGSVTIDTSFLGEIMEWNEQVEDANTKDHVENLKKDVDVILVNLYKELSKTFSENNLSQATLLLSKAKYFSTLLEKIKNKDV